METVLIIAGNARSLIANRGDLIRALQQRQVRVAAIVPKDDYLPEVEKLGIEIYTTNLERTKAGLFSDILACLELYRIIRSVRPTVVLSYTAKCVIYGSIAARWAKVHRIFSMITGLGHVYTTHSLKTRILRKITAALYRFSLNRNQAVFFQNPDDEAEFLSSGILKQSTPSVRINGSWVNLERFARTELPEGSHVAFLFAGRLLHEKGIGEFCQAAEIVAKRCPKAKFIVVGPHDPRLPHAWKIEELERWKREPYLQFTGGGSDVRPWIAKCSVFVLPSYREGTPRVVLEAMSMGRPIITTDAPGCRETVANGINGFLVPPRAVEPLAEAMMRFLDTPQIIRSMADESYRIVREKYDVNKVNKVILQTMGIE